MNLNVLCTKFMSLVWFVKVSQEKRMQPSQGKTVFAYLRRQQHSTAGFRGGAIQEAYPESQEAGSGQSGKQWSKLRGGQVKC